MAHDEDPDTIRREFADAVNMTASELERWLETDESRSVGQKDTCGLLAPCGTGSLPSSFPVSTSITWKYGASV